MGVFLIAPLLLVVVKRYSHKLKHMGRNKQETSGELNSKLQETLSGIRVIKAFTTENYEKSQFKNSGLQTLDFIQEKESDMKPKQIQ